MVCVGHQEDAADAGLEVLFGEAVGLVLEGGPQGVAERDEGGLNGDGVGLDAEVLRERGGIVEGALRGELAGHEEPDDTVRSERADGERCGEGGVDAAGEAEESAREARLMKVVADACDECLEGEVDGVGVGQVWGLVEAVEVEGVGGLEEGRRELFCAAVWEHEEAVSVEDEFVVRAYLVEVEDGGLELGGGGSEGGASALKLAVGEGACGEVDEEVGGLGVVEWVVAVAGSEFGVVAGPEVFADGEQECSAAKADGCESVSGQEVSGLIEDVIGGQQELVVSGEQSSVFDEECCVLVLVGSALVGEREPDEESRPTACGAGECEERLGDRLVKSGAVEEIAWRVACEREFGGDDEVGAGGAGEVEGREDAVGVVGKVSDPRIELRCEDLQG